MRGPGYKLLGGESTQTHQRTRWKVGKFRRLLGLSDHPRGALFWRRLRKDPPPTPDYIMDPSISDEEAIAELAKTSHGNMQEVSQLLLELERGRITHKEVRKRVADHLKKQKDSEAQLRHHLGRTRQDPEVLNRGISYW